MEASKNSTRIRSIVELVTFVDRLMREQTANTAEGKYIVIRGFTITTEEHDKLTHALATLKN